MVNREEIRAWMKANGMLLKDLSESSGIQYDRLVHILNGFRKANPEEDAKLADLMRQTT